MLILNITTKVMHSIEQDWLQWMKSTWIKEMQDTGLFGEHRFCKLQGNDDEEGVMYVTQFHCDTLENYNTFLSEQDERLRSLGHQQFGNAFISFRTIMEIIH
ncbi:DUF4286 family protein [Taibaiella sp. KBW10]|uniref:DUF4286 family protein n=1 Tax=Taibaiella sp. KBW10 TaxID=2153357 RepID=UPI0013153423|nr:DUF4286 family protein [Taibaiella sp. KBW10]